MSKPVVNRFEELIVWQEARKINTSLYQSIGDSKVYFMRDHLLKTALSISSNIAEGFERKSNKEFQRFLYIARGSCGELRSQLYLANDLDLLSESKSQDLIEHCKRISSLIYKLIHSLPPDK